MAKIFFSVEVEGKFLCRKILLRLVLCWRSVSIRYEQVVCNKISILALLSKSRGMLNNSDILGLIPFAVFAMRHLGKVSFVVQPQFCIPALLHCSPGCFGLSAALAEQHLPNGSVILFLELLIIFQLLWGCFFLASIQEKEAQLVHL